MKQGIIYGGTFVFAFVIVTGLLIYLNSSCENIFEFNFAPKSIVQVPDSIKTDSLNMTENRDLITEPDTGMGKDSVLLSSVDGSEIIDTVNKVKIDSANIKNLDDKQDLKKGKENIDPIKLKPEQSITQQQELKTEMQDEPRSKEYEEWIKKVTSIYSAMESKKAAKIIQTYSDNVARDILYNMNKKTAAKVVSEFSPETANRIFRFE